MDFSIKILDVKNVLMGVKIGVLVVGIYENCKLFKVVGVFDKLGVISVVLKLGDIFGKLGLILLLCGVIGIVVECIVLLGLGNEDEGVDKNFVVVSSVLVCVLVILGCDDVVLVLFFDGIKGCGLDWVICIVVLVGCDVVYCFDMMKSKKDLVFIGVRKIILLVVVE